jgi:glycine reductase
MELELRYSYVKDIVLSDSTRIDNGVLKVDTEELKLVLMEDDRIEDVKFDVAKPGDSIRILPVKDVVEPRCKADGDGFPGLVGEIYEAGRGTTYVLKNAAVITTGPIVGFQEGIIDMSGPLVDYTPFSKLFNLVVSVFKKPGVTPHEHEEVVRMAGVRAANYLAKACMPYGYDDSEVFNWRTFTSENDGNTELPRVAYVYQCVGQGLLHDTYFYGKDSKLMLPTMINPLEAFDGALVSGHCVSAGSKTTTFHHQNNAVIRECFKRHGKEINFVGAVVSPMTTVLQDKYRNSMITAKLVELIGADGVVQSQEGFGNPTTDLMMICKRLENKGIKTVLISNEDAGVDGKSESLPDGVEEATAIVSTGNSNARMRIPKMDKIIGDLDALEHITGGFVGSRQEDGSLIIEIHGIIGGHNLQGYSYLSATTI